MNPLVPPAPGAKSKYDGLVPWLVPICGALMAIWLLGQRALNPNDTGWMRGDVAQAYIGWAHFAQDTEWRFPLTFTPRLNAPIGSCISYNNSIPLLAVALRGVAQPPPDPFQYQGLFALSCGILQAVFGYRLCAKWTNDRWKAFWGCLFMVTAPPFLMRFSHDLVLICHWPILASLCLCTPAESDKRISYLPLRYSLILAIAGGINPYIAVMCLVVMCAAVYRDVMNHPWGWMRRTIVWLVPVAVLLACWISFGFLQFGERGAQAGLGGYGEFSMNLLAPINPHLNLGEAIPSSDSPVFKSYEVFPQQYEGYNYFGGGTIVLILGTLVLLKHPRNIIRGLGWGPIWVVAGISILMAVTTKITFGRSVLLEVPLPYYPVKQMLSTFRASGRFFWPAYYIVLIACLQCWFHRASRRSFFWIVPFLLCFQLWDTLSLQRMVKGVLNPPQSISPFKDSFWTGLGNRFDKVVVLPAWQVMPNDSSLPGGPESWLPFGMLTAKNGWALNVNYQARPNLMDDRMQRDILPASIVKGELADDTLYVLGPRYLFDFCESKFTHIICKSVDGLLVFWKGTPSAANLAALAALKEGVFSRGLDLKEVSEGFDFPIFPMPYVADRGVTLPEGEYLFSTGVRSEIPLYLGKVPKLRKIEVGLKPVLGPGISAQVVRVSVAGRDVGEYRVEKPETLTIEIPAEVIESPAQTGSVALSFEWITAAKSDQITVRQESNLLAGLRRVAAAIGFKPGNSRDTRLWAVGIHAIRLQSEE